MVSSATHRSGGEPVSCPRWTAVRSRVPLGQIVEELRMVKDETEIALLAYACAIACEARLSSRDVSSPPEMAVPTE